MSDAIIHIDVHTSLGDLLLPLEFDSVSGYGASFVPADFVPYMADSTTLQAGIWNIIVNTEYYDSYAADSIDITVNAPDLSITPLDISFSPSSPEEGDMVLIDAMIRNVGTAESDSSFLSFFIDQMDASGQVGADYLIPPLAVGDSVTISVMWNTTEQTGDHTIYVQIDPNQWSLDSDRSNNLASTIVTVDPGYICGDVDASSAVNVADLTYLVDYLFFEGPAPPVMEAANVDGEGGINVADLTYLVDYLFFEGPEPICGPIE